MSGITNEYTVERLEEKTKPLRDRPHAVREDITIIKKATAR